LRRDDGPVGTLFGQEVGRIARMLPHFFRLARVSPTRRRAFASLALAHLLALGLLILGMRLTGDGRVPLGVGNLLIIAGIVEGALLIGWRLTQLPKTQALE